MSMFAPRTPYEAAWQAWNYGGGAQRGEPMPQPENFPPSFPPMVSKDPFGAPSSRPDPLKRVPVAMPMPDQTVYGRFGRPSRQAAPVSHTMPVDRGRFSPARPYPNTGIGGTDQPEPARGPMNTSLPPIVRADGTVLERQNRSGWMPSGSLGSYRK